MKRTRLPFLRRSCDDEQPPIVEPQASSVRWLIMGGPEAAARVFGTREVVQIILSETDLASLSSRTLAIETGFRVIVISGGAHE
jgi:hypothetical protein